MIPRCHALILILPTRSPFPPTDRRTVIGHRVRRTSRLEDGRKVSLRYQRRIYVQIVIFDSSMIVEFVLSSLNIILPILQVTLAAGTVLTPLYYEKYSIFAQRARHAIGEIEMVENHDVVAGLATISSGDKGFNELLTVLRKNGNVVDNYKYPDKNIDEKVEVVKIGHAFGNRRQLSNFLDGDPEFFAERESVIYTHGQVEHENVDDRKSVVLRNSNFNIRPGSYAVGEQMVQNMMYRWVSETAQERANRLTAFVVVLWTTALFIN